MWRPQAVTFVPLGKPFPVNLELYKIPRKKFESYKHMMHVKLNKNKTLTWVGSYQLYKWYKWDPLLTPETLCGGSWDLW